MDIGDIVVKVAFESGQFASGVDSAIGKLNQLGEAAGLSSGKIGQIGSSLGMGGAAFTGAAIGITAVAAALGASVAAAASWQSSMANVQRATGLQGQAFQQLSNDLLKLSTQIPATATQLANLATVGSKMGVGQDQLTKFTEIAGKMGTVFKMPAEQAAQQVAALFNSMNVPIDTANLESFADVVTKAGSSCTASSSEIMAFIASLDPLASTVGMSITQMASLAAAIDKTGGDLGKTSKTLTMVGKATLGDAEKRKTAAAILGIPEQEYVKKASEDLIATQMEMAQKLQAMSPTQKMEAVSGLGAKGPAGLELYDALADAQKDYTANMTKMDAAGGSFAEKFAAQSKEAANQWQLLGNSINVVGVQLGSALLPPINEAISLFGDLINIVDELGRKFTNFLGTGAGGLDVKGKVIGATDTLSNTLLGLMGEKSGEFRGGKWGTFTGAGGEWVAAISDEVNGKSSELTSSMTKTMNAAGAQAGGAAGVVTAQAWGDKTIEGMAKAGDEAAKALFEKIKGMSHELQNFMNIMPGMQTSRLIGAMEPDIDKTQKELIGKFTNVLGDPYYIMKQTKAGSSGGGQLQAYWGEYGKGAGELAGSNFWSGFLATGGASEADAAKQMMSGLMEPTVIYPERLVKTQTDQIGIDLSTALTDGAVTGFEKAALEADKFRLEHLKDTYPLYFTADDQKLLDNINATLQGKQFKIDVAAQVKPYVEDLSTALGRETATYQSKEFYQAMTPGSRTAWMDQKQAFKEIMEDTSGKYDATRIAEATNFYNAMTGVETHTQDTTVASTELVALETQMLAEYPKLAPAIKEELASYLTKVVTGVATGEATGSYLPNASLTPLQGLIKAYQTGNYGNILPYGASTYSGIGARPTMPTTWQTQPTGTLLPSPLSTFDFSQLGTFATVGASGGATQATAAISIATATTATNTSALNATISGTTNPALSTIDSTLKSLATEETAKLLATESTLKLAATEATQKLIATEVTLKLVGTEATLKLVATEATLKALLPGIQAALSTLTASMTSAITSGLAGVASAVAKSTSASAVGAGAAAGIRAATGGGGGVGSALQWTGWGSTTGGGTGSAPSVPSYPIGSYQLPSALQWTGWAEGAIVDKATPGVFGERGREAFVPIYDKAAGLRILPQVMKELGCMPPSQFATWQEGSGSSQLFIHSAATGTIARFAGQWSAIYDNSGTCIAYTPPDLSLKWTPGAVAGGTVGQYANQWNAIYNNAGACIGYAPPDPSLKFTPAATPYQPYIGSTAGYGVPGASNFLSGVGSELAWTGWGKAPTVGSPLPVSVISTPPTSTPTKGVGSGLTWQGWDAVAPSVSSPLPVTVISAPSTVTGGLPSELAWAGWGAGIGMAPSVPYMPLGTSIMPGMLGQTGLPYTGMYSAAPGGIMTYRGTAGGTGMGRLTEFDSYIASAESGLSSCIQLMSDWGIAQESILSNQLFYPEYIGKTPAGGYQGPGYGATTGLPNYFNLYPSSAPFMQQAVARGMLGSPTPVAMPAIPRVMTLGGTTSSPTQSATNPAIQSLIQLPSIFAQVGTKTIGAIQQAGSQQTLATQKMAQNQIAHSQAIITLARSLASAKQTIQFGTGTGSTTATISSFPGLSNYTGSGMTPTGALDPAFLIAIGQAGLMPALLAAATGGGVGGFGGIMTMGGLGSQGLINGYLPAGLSGGLGANYPGYTLAGGQPLFGGVSSYSGMGGWIGYGTTAGNPAFVGASVPTWGGAAASYNLSTYGSIYSPVPAGQPAQFNPATFNFAALGGTSFANPYVVAPPPYWPSVTNAAYSGGGYYTGVGGSTSGGAAGNSQGGSYGGWVPAFQEGGFKDQEVIARIAEGGPEYIIPARGAPILRQTKPPHISVSLPKGLGGNLGGLSSTVIVQGDISSEVRLHQILDERDESLLEKIALNAKREELR